MSKANLPHDTIERIRRQLTEETPNSDDAQSSADVRWARAVLAGEDAAPPGAALRPEVTQAVVEELLAHSDGDRLGQLARSAHKEVAKVARGALHRLRSKRQLVALPAPTQRDGAGTGQAIQRGLMAVASVYDGKWERLVWLPEEVPSGLIIHQARISAMHGLFEYAAGRATRRSYRDRVRMIVREIGGGEIDLDQANWLITDAELRCRAAGRTVPDDYGRARQFLGKAQVGPHPALVIEPASTPVKDLIHIMQLPELRMWRPDRMFLTRMAVRMEEALQSQLVLNEAQRLEQLRAVAARSVAEYYTDAQCAACRQLLLDTAHLMLVKGADSRACRDVRAAAELFASPTDQVAQDAFARHFVQGTLDRIADRFVHERLVFNDESGADHDHHHDGLHHHHDALPAGLDRAEEPKGSIILP